MHMTIPMQPWLGEVASIQPACWDPTCLPMPLGISLHGLPLASMRWSSPACSGGPGRVTSWRRHWCCKRMRRCAGQGCLCSPFQGAWSSLEERRNACQRQGTHSSWRCLLAAYCSSCSLFTFPGYRFSCALLQHHGPCTAEGPYVHHGSVLGVTNYTCH